MEVPEHDNSLSEGAIMETHLKGVHHPIGQDSHLAGN